MIEDINNFNILTSAEEQLLRKTLCDSCENKRTIESGNICNGCACPIEYVTMYKFKSCPLKKWEV